MCTNTAGRNLALFIDEQTVARARNKAEAQGKGLNQLIRDYLQKLVGAMIRRRVSKSSGACPDKATRAAGGSIGTRFMNARSFFETNVVVYADDKAPPTKQHPSGIP